MIERDAHPIERVMDNAFAKMKGLVKADAVVGEPVTTADGTSIIPVSRVTMGFVTGGGEYDSGGKDEGNFAGGSGAGMTVTPVCFLVSDGKCVKLVGVDDESALEKLLSLVPDLLERLAGGKDGGKRGAKR